MFNFDTLCSISTLLHVRFWHFSALEEMAWKQKFILNFNFLVSNFRHYGFRTTRKVINFDIMHISTQVWQKRWTKMQIVQGLLFEDKLEDAKWTNRGAHTFSMQDTFWILEEESSLAWNWQDTYKHWNSTYIMCRPIQILNL